MTATVLDTVATVRDRPDAVEPGRMRGLVEFSGVSFSYDGKRPAVADLTFTVLPGQTVALVGATGAGKSTALALLHRVFDPQSGVIKIDGMDIKGITLSGLRLYGGNSDLHRACQENLTRALRESAARARAWSKEVARG